MDAGFEILHERRSYLVAGKPPGLPTQAPPGIDCLEQRVRRCLLARDGRPLTAHLGVVHRLDRPASGALLIGLTRKATRELGRQVEQRLVRKRYWALVAGRVTPAAGTWSDTMRKVPDEARAELVPAGHPDARRAELRYRTLHAGVGHTWLEIELVTGRTHQIRLQAASRGHPILGDRLYGSTRPFGPGHEDPRLLAIALHARALSFGDPLTQAAVHVEAAPPPSWRPFMPE